MTTNKFEVNGQFQYTNHVNPAKSAVLFLQAAIGKDIQT